MRRVLAVCLALCALAACSESAKNYGKGTEAAFLETCTARQQTPGPICTCMYQEITQRIPFDRYVELDKQMQADEKFVPDELVAIAADCATQLTTTTTESTTTTLPPSTFSTFSSSSSTSSSSTSSTSSSSSTSGSSSSASGMPFSF